MWQSILKYSMSKSNGCCNYGIRRHNATYRNREPILIKSWLQVLHSAMEMSLNCLEKTSTTLFSRTHMIYHLHGSQIIEANPQLHELFRITRTVTLTSPRMKVWCSASYMHRLWRYWRSIPLIKSDIDTIILRNDAILLIIDTLNQNEQNDWTVFKQKKGIVQLDATVQESTNTHRKVGELSVKHLHDYYFWSAPSQIDQLIV